MPSIRYQPEIDGLRALAVVPVLLFHLDLPWAASGFMGVDVFFVISGYLISSIALAEVQTGDFSLRRFWSRRIRRILPLTAVVVAATCAASALLMFSPGRKEVGLESLASLGSVANLYFWRATGDYWGAAAERAPLLHTWSLAVEEHFYLVFPFVAAWLFRKRRQTACVAVTTVIAVSAAAYLLLSPTRPAACFYLMPTRAWELGLGVLLALIPAEAIPDGARRVALPLGLGAMLIAYAAPERIGQSPAFLAVPVIGAALVIAGVGAPAGWSTLRLLLRARPLIHVGLLSFALYLWHWPIFVTARYLNYQVSAPAVATLVMSITYALAWASHVLVERPVRSARRGVMIAVAMIAAAGIGASALFATSTPPTPAAAKATWFGHLYAVGSGADPEVLTRQMRGVTLGQLPGSESKPTVESGVRGGAAAGAERVIVMGDSHAMMWSNQISQVCAELGVAARFWCANGTSPFTTIPPSLGAGSPGLRPDELLTFDRARLASLESESPGVLVLVARWSAVPNMDAGTQFIEHALSLGWKVLLIKQPPELWFGEMGALEFLAESGWKVDDSPDRCCEASLETERFRNVVRALEAIDSASPLCDTVNVQDRLLDGCDGQVRLTRREVCVYIDDDHLSEEGVCLFRGRLEQALETLLGKR